MSLAEVMFALGILSMFTLAIILVMIRGMDLNRRDAAITQSTMYCNEVMDQDARLAADPQLWSTLPTVPFTFFPQQQEFLYAQSVADYSPTIRRVTVAVYYQDPTKPTPTPDPRRGQRGQVVQLTTLFVRPTRPAGAP